jgi:hypothetical protein
MCAAWVNLTISRLVHAFLRFVPRVFTLQVPQVPDEEVPQEEEHSGLASRRRHFGRLNRYPR